MGAEPAMKTYLIALLGIALPVSAQVYTPPVVPPAGAASQAAPPPAGSPTLVPLDPCAGLVGFARDDCLSDRQRAAQEQQRALERQQQLQQQLLMEQIRGYQLQ